jgi:hypothetical protein
MRSGGISPPFLTSVLDGGEWSASRPGRRRGKCPEYPMGGLQIRSGRCEEEKKLLPCRVWNPNSSALWPVARRYAD